MCLRSVLWPVIWFSVPSFCSMACYLALCVFVWFYGLLSRSMCLRSVLWPVISFYVPSFATMDCYLAMFLRLVLWPVISFSVPSFCSMDLHLVLCAFVQFYGPSSCSMLHPLSTSVGPFIYISVLNSHNSGKKY